MVEGNPEELSQERSLGMKYFYLFLAILMPIGGCSLIVNLWTDPLRVDVRVFTSFAVFLWTVIGWADCSRKAIQAVSKEYSDSISEDEG